MLQKRNDFEIIELLRKAPKHIRKISQELGLIPSTTMRVLRKLQKENVVDFKVEGKNNVYFLKESHEAHAYLFMTEEYKLLKALQEPKLRRIITEVQEQTTGELVVLFGSYAKGTAKKESDIDIYLETENRKLREDLRLISEELSIKIGKLDKKNPLTREMIKEHVIIQNIERFYQAIR